MKIKKKKLTNGGKPHKCGVIAVHNTPSNKGISLCSRCFQPVDEDDDSVTNSNMKTKSKKSEQVTKDYVIEKFSMLADSLEKRLNVHITYNIDHILLLKKK